MKTQVKLFRASGKTVDRVVEGYNDLMIVFTDDTFAFLSPRSGYEGDANIEEPDYFKRWHSNEIATDEVIAAGVLSREEAKALDDKVAAEHTARTEASERAAYERLKEKYDK